MGLRAEERRERAREKTGFGALAGRRQQDAKGKDIEAEPWILEALTPGSVDFGMSDVEVDGEYRKYVAIRRFPTENRTGWLDRLKGEAGSHLCITVAPPDPVRLVKSIDHTDARAGMGLINGGTASKEVELEIDREHARAMMEMVSNPQKAFLSVSVTTELTDADPEALTLKARRLKESLTGAGMQLDMLVNAQKRAYRRCDPMADGSDAYLAPRFVTDMPADTLAAALPFDGAGVLDDEGTVLGVDGALSCVRADMLTPSMARSNMNGVVVGASGKGKSHLLKLIAADEYARAGARVIWLDWEQEARFLCQRLHGQYVCAAGRGARCCPTQYRALSFDYSAQDDPDADGVAATDILRSTVSFLDGFYQLAFGVGSEELRYLERGLERAYSKKGVGYDTPSEVIDFTDYPTMDEVAQSLHELAHDAKDDKEREVLLRLAAHTERGGDSGLFGNLWGGKTNITLESDFVAFDLSGLQSLPDGIRDAQMYSILTFVWSEVCRSRLSGRPLRIIVDEAHLVFGGSTDTDGATCARSPIAASLLAQIVRRARKYNAGLLVATQSLKDFFAPNVRQYAEAIIDNSAYLFAFAQTKAELASDALRIPLQKAVELGGYPRGKCVFRAEGEVCDLSVDRAETLTTWLGRAGGR